MFTGAVQVNKIKLKHARAQANLTQEELAHLAGVARQVVANSERGLTISQISAWAVLNALNRVREGAGMRQLEFEEMDWKVQGEK
jgi:DNA-binding XRE family transcriptional regulator